jgi:hypothetical protein
VEESRDDRTLRASDADRERIAEQLRQAAGDGRLTLAELHDRLDALYAAKTYGELEPVVADLPREQRTASAFPSPPPSTAVERRVGGTPVARTAKAVFSGLSRRGQWIVPSHYTVKAVFGGAELDLRQALLESDDVTIDITAVFGGVEIVVPDDVIAIVDGSGIFGAFDFQDSTTQPEPGAPVVRIGGKAVFGGVWVHRRTRESRG